MHTSNIWNKLHLHRIKILTTFCLFIFIVTHSQGQNFRQTNLPDYDNRTLHFGFTVGGHTSTYKLKYNDQFNGIDSLHSIVPNNTPGFSIGFLANFHLLQYLDVRPMFKVAFYEFPVDYNFTDGSTIPQLVEAAYVELPLLVKYRSLRRRNFGMYLVGGVSPGIQVEAD